MSATKYRRLTRGDLTTFDPSSTSFVLELGEYGWVGRISAKGHAIMRAPDGRTTTSVSRKHEHKRNAINARKEFQRWLKRQDLTPDPAPTSKDVYPQSVTKTAPGAPISSQGYLDTTPTPDRAGEEKEQHDMSTSTHLTQKPDAPNAVRQAIEESEEIYRKDFPHACPDCEKRFDNRFSLSAHRRVHLSNSRRRNDIPHTLEEAAERGAVVHCELCGDPFANTKARGAHRRIHHPNWRKQLSAETTDEQAPDEQQQQQQQQPAVAPDLIAFAQQAQQVSEHVGQLAEENKRLREEVQDLRARLELVRETIGL